MKKMNQQSINKIIFYKLFESDTLPQVQPPIDTKTNNQMSNDSFITNVPTNKTSLKRIPSDIPKPSPEHEEWEEYVRWLEREMKEWEKANPYPVWEDNMTQAEWETLVQMWLIEQQRHQIEIENLYRWRIRDGLGLPRPDRKPEAREPNETSPKPPVVLPYPGMISPWIQHNDGPQRGYWDDDWVRGREWA
jgi:hypothetical protein